MTDNEIIKALECCIKDQHEGCCKLGSWSEQWNCMADLMKDALSLINRQKAEIERLQGELEQRTNAYFIKVEQRKNARAEAIKEFAERLKEHSRYPNGTIYVEHIDNLVKEMVGD